MSIGCRAQRHGGCWGRLRHGGCWGRLSALQPQGRPLQQACCVISPVHSPLSAMSFERQSSVTEKGERPREPTDRARPQPASAPSRLNAQPQRVLFLAGTRVSMGAEACWGSPGCTEPSCVTGGACRRSLVAPPGRRACAWHGRSPQGSWLCGARCRRTFPETPPCPGSGESQGSGPAWRSGAGVTHAILRSPAKQASGA